MGDGLLLLYQHQSSYTSYNIYNIITDHNYHQKISQPLLFYIGNIPSGVSFGMKTDPPHEFHRHLLRRTWRSPSPPDLLRSLQRLRCGWGLAKVRNRAMEDLVI